MTARKDGKPQAVTPAGAAIAHLRAHVAHTGNDCLIWPYYRDLNGYGRVSQGRQMKMAHRVMCRLAHGEPPTPKHQSAHSCGKGHEGCFNPCHLSWKTHAENLLDCREHGTSTRAGKRKMTPELVAQMLALIGSKPKIDLARQFGISLSTVIYYERYREEKGYGRKAA